MSTPSGGRNWCLKYRFARKEKKLTFGPYPEVTLAEARNKRDAARRLIRDDIDPSVERKNQSAKAVAAAGVTFEKVARDWYETNAAMWGDVHAGDVIRSLERDVFPSIGDMPIRTIETPKVLEVLRAIEKRPAIETAKRVRQRMSAVFVYAISQGLATADPALVVRGALKPLRKGKQPAITDLTKARRILVDCGSRERPSGNEAGASPARAHGRPAG